MTTVIHETAWAKVNLDLRVCRRRDDGYHDLDSLVVFADFGDRLRFARAEDLTLQIEGPFAGDLEHVQDNLVLKAAQLLASAFGRLPDVHITLDKRLPIASGIGGGSADAAATLRGLVRLWDLPMTMGDLASLAPSLGADVKACLGSRPVKMTGIGDRPDIVRSARAPAGHAGQSRNAGGDSFDLQEPPTHVGGEISSLKRGRRHCLSGVSAR